MKNDDGSVSNMQSQGPYTPGRISRALFADV